MSSLETVGQATIKLMTPEEIAARAGGAPAQALRLPEGSTLFAERAMRLRQLAAGHAMRDYLLFLADLAEAQQLLLPALLQAKLSTLPTADQLAEARAAGLPPLPAAEWPRDPAWREALAGLVERLLPQVLAPTRGVLQQLGQAEPAWLEYQADRLLGGVMLGLDLAAAPLIAAALQCYWLALVAQTAARHAQPQQTAFMPAADATRCPCCGSRPTASITRQFDEVAGQRYLHCSLCASEWHMVRIQCPHCLSGKGLAYQSLQALVAQGAPAAAAGQTAVQAESCDDCGHYLKIVHSERDPFVEPVADDLASLTLDLLVSDAGLKRHGVNLLLLFGDEEQAAPDVGTASPPDPGGSP